MIPIPPQPLRELPPHEERAVERLDVGQDGGPGGREARHGLEVGVDRARELRLVGEQVRKRPESRDGQPGERDDQEALAKPDELLAPSGPLDDEACPAGDGCCREKRPDRLVGAERDQSREEKGGREVWDPRQRG